MDAEEQAVKLTARDTLQMGATCGICGLKLTPGTVTCPNDGFRVKPEFSAGTEIAGKYTFVEPIGEGGMSAVYKATDPILDRVVAVKMLHQHYANSEIMLKRFRQEGRAIGQLNHPNIVRVHEFGMLEHGQPFIVMDYIEGSSLQKLLQLQGPLSNEQALSMFKQIASALEHAHSRGILHRDLKPSNVMINLVGEEPQVTIVDFGIAKIIEPTAESARLTTTGEIFGSPLYMSPEQCKGMPVDVRSDIYSVGCLMYEAITGKSMYDASNPLEVLFKQMNEQPRSFTERAPEKNVPKVLEQIIFRVLEKEAANRYQSATELLHALDTMQPGEVELKRDRPARRLPRAILALGVTALLAAGASSAVWYWQRQHRPQEKRMERPITRPLPKTHRGASIADARLSGTWNQLTNLPAVDLGHSDVTNEGLNYIGKLPKLQLLGLAHTGISDLRPLANCRKLSILILDSTKVNDRSMSALGGLQLTKLHLNGTAITDSGVMTIENQASLDDLQLAATHVTNACGPALSKLTNLKQLILDQTQIGDQLIPYLPPSLKVLSIDETNVTDAGLARLDGLSQLNKFYLGKCPVTDKGLHYVSSLSNLTELWVDSESITDVGVAFLQKLRLSKLLLQHATITDESMRSIANCPTLDTLDLIDCPITDNGLKRLTALTKLQTLNLHGCHGVTDAAIDTLLQLKNLKALSVAETKISMKGLLRLKGLPQLETLVVIGIPTSPAEMDKLQATLPKCNILGGSDPEPRSRRLD